MKTTEEKNRMIAEFMGVEFNKIGERYMASPVPSEIGSCWEDQLKYHTSWDWLMPVVSKMYIESKRLDEMKSFRMSHIIQNFQTAVVNNEIAVAHHYALDGINLLNKQK